jgi:hypothetical protein
MKEIKKMTIIKDTREQKGWDFSPNKYCTGMINQALKSADYSIDGLQNKVLIERKATVAEISGNLYDKRFEAELKRMKDIPHKFVICEFLLNDLYSFPFNSGIPQNVWSKLRVSSLGLVKRLFELELKYNVHFIFAGQKGKEVAFTIFKQVAEMYPNDIV